MAAVALTKTQGRPHGTLGATRVWESDPSVHWYTAAAITDGDTTTFTKWTGPLPRAVFTKGATTNEGFSCEFALSSGDLVLTYQGNNQTAGSLVGIQR